MSIFLIWNFLGKCLILFQDPPYQWSYICIALIGYISQRKCTKYLMHGKAEAMRNQNECWQQNWRSILKGFILCEAGYSSDLRVQNVVMEKKVSTQRYESIPKFNITTSKPQQRFYLGSCTPTQAHFFFHISTMHCPLD